ncbi:MAG: hypothetical protein RJS97_08585 [Parvibaculaceae bacterium]
MSTHHVSLRVSPTPSLKPEGQDTPTSRLTESTPHCVVGGPRIADPLDVAVHPNPSSCFGPRGAAFMQDGTLVVADTGHHRLLGWREPPTDRQDADWIIGQPDFQSEGRNAKSEVCATSLNVPTGLCAAGAGLAVADAWNHRVLLWDNVPIRNNQAPDRVLGQPDFTNATANDDDPSRASARTFHWPYGVCVHNQSLFVADAENRRVLIWHNLMVENGAPADLVLGQPNFTARDENAGNSPTAHSMRWPHDLTVWHGHLCVTDAGNNRIMVWDGVPEDNFAPCRWVLGQSNFATVEHNQALYWPRNNTLNMPYGLTAWGDWLLCSDTANSRVLAWHIDDLDTGAPARCLLGQPTFADKGDNRWLPAAEDSFCWPYGIASNASQLLIADSGNNRISVWNFLS